MSERIRLRDRTLANDIKYSPPLSYRYLRIIAWVLLAFSQCALVIKFNMKINSLSTDYVQGAYRFFSVFANFPLPLFLIANFAYILQHRNKLKHLIIFYTGLCTVVYLAATFVTIHYFYGFASSFEMGLSLNQVCNLVGAIFMSLGQSGSVFNIFIDLLLCSLIYFFINYNPKKYFKGNKLIIFRLFFLIPVAWEIFAITYKSLFITQNIDNYFMNLPSYLFFLFPSKPPMMFFAFVTIVFFLKYTDIRRKKRHLDDDEFHKEHLKTNAHAFLISIAMIVVFAIFAVLDLIVCTLVSSIYYEMNYSGYGSEGIAYAIQDANMLGFGKTMLVLFIVPIFLLFSYTKEHKNKTVDLFVPIGGIVLVLFIYIEGMFQVTIHNGPQLLQRMADWIENLLS